MAIDLPMPIANYFAAKGGDDTAATLECFTKDATVWDNGEDRELKGHGQISEWLSGTIATYKLSSEVKSIESKEGTHVVGVVISGDFPGSPYEFSNRFTLSGDKVSELVIDPIGPYSS